MAKRSTNAAERDGDTSAPDVPTTPTNASTATEMNPEERRERIATAAYYRAERRNFAGDAGLDDWLEAEREIDSAAAARGIQGEASLLQEGPGDRSASAIRSDPADDPDHIVPSEVPRVAEELGVPAKTLRVAIERAGPRISDVKRYLEQHGKG